MKAFRLPAAEPPTVSTPARPPARPSPMPFSPASGYRVGADIRPPIKAAVRPAQREQAQVPAGDSDLSFIIATEARLSGFFGDIILRCKRENVDLKRLDAGLLALAVDHDSEKLIGVVKTVTFKASRVYGTASYITGALTDRIRGEIDQGARRGISPGFLVHEYEIDQDEAFIVTLWEPYEISSTSIPRNPEAIVLNLGRPAMTLHEATGPDVLNTSDLAGLSLALGRRVLRDGKGSAAQRERLEAFFSEYDEAIGRGLPRDAAVKAAKSRTLG